MPTKVQVAFQGGGAKLIPLLAVAHAFRDAEKAGDIEITKLAGTSAGAIAACLLATREDFQIILNHLSKNGGDIVSTIAPGEVSIWNPITSWKLLTGRPLVDERNVHRALHEIFSLFGKKYLKFSDLAIPVRVTATELMTESMHYLDAPEREIARELVHSCGLPFVIKSLKNLGWSPALVDGGLCENLPSDALSESSGEGIVLGVSFKKNSVKHDIGGLKGFAASLLSAAIENSVSRARSKLREEYVFPIDTHLTTFAFKEAVAVETLRDHYALIRGSAAQWIKDTLKPLPLSNPESVVVIKPVEEIRPEREMQSNLYEVFKLHHEGAKYRVKRIALTVVANCLSQSHQPESKLPDIVTQELEFTVTSETIYGLSFRIDGGSESQAAQGTAQFEMFDETGQPHEVIAIPVLNVEDNRPPSRHVVIYFKEPLKVEEPAKTYTLRQRDGVADCMAPLRETGADYLSLVRGSPMPAERADLVLFVPIGYPEIELSARMKVTKERTPIVGRKMTDQELGRYDTPLGFRRAGWTGSGLSKDKQFSVDFTAKKS